MTNAARILIVEDEWLVAEDHACQVADLGYRVVGPVPSVQRALDCLATEGDVDMALLDIQLARELSFPIADSLSQRQIPFAFASGQTRSDLPARFADTPMLQKPINPADLAATIRSILQADTDEA